MWVVTSYLTKICYDITYIYIIILYISSKFPQARKRKKKLYMFQKMNNMSNKKEWLQSFLFFEVMEIPFFEVILHTTTIIIPWSLVSIN